jgi:AraC family transcriptional regulator of adaptative response/methylated-DNA-[protein]-cysteine methyltransferase
LKEINMNMIRSEVASEVFRFAYGDSRLGIVLVAISHRGIVAILLGDDRRKLLRELEGAFPAISMIEDGEACCDAVLEVAAFIDAPQYGLALPLDMRGSELQLAVWTALRAIPSGATRTYGALAKALPVTATAQDVGAACAANVLAVAVPCHRVVKADGSISGYRWGVHRKRRLINIEGVA